MELNIKEIRSGCDWNLEMTQDRVQWNAFSIIDTVCKNCKEHGGERS
jgi:hypothetical protein